MEQKYVYSFGNGTAEGNKDDKILLGGKGANLAEMNLIGLAVPPGFTISTEACTQYFQKGRNEVLAKIKKQVQASLEKVEKITGKHFGDPNNPLLLSVRSGARISMPGMMDTVLNLGLNDEVTEGFARITNNERLAWDSYRRFVQMYGSVVLGLKPEFKEDHDPFEVIIDNLKDKRGVVLDTDFSIGDLQELVILFKKRIKDVTGKPIPEDPFEQLWAAIVAVFDSWIGNRAFQYRKINNIPHDWGTAVNVQTMVFGNSGNSSATGVAFTRDPATGVNEFVGEYLVNAQGEDVVAGTRTPQQITKSGSQKWAELANVTEEVRRQDFMSLEELMPTQFKELDTVRTILENHYKEMQDLEFTIENGKLWILQTRTGKRTGAAMIKVATDMMEEGLIDEHEAIMRIDPAKLDELLHPVFDIEELENATEISHGLAASPGAASGQLVFFASDAEEWQDEGKKVILVRIETSPEDIKGMDCAEGILTTRGGMTSHAAVVARGMGKCCITGAGSINIDYNKRILSVNGRTFKEGDWISLNGTTGQVFEGKLKTIDPEISGNFKDLMNIADRQARMAVMANADTPRDAAVALNFGAKGIGLCRTEHMFFEGDRIKLVREMILAHDVNERQKALDKLLPIQRSDFEGILGVMHDLPVTFRLLDPPLHEFLPGDEEGMMQMAKDLNVSFGKVEEMVSKLHETNPMLGHRGCRLANTFPEISEMQTRAILEAALKLKAKGINARPEIMVPLTSISRELKQQLDVVRKTAEIVFEEHGARIDYKIGTMIEIPRAVIIADIIAPMVDFFSFGTNDLTQMTFGFSRDDIGKFLPIYLSKGIMKADPFQTIDQYGVGKLVKVGTSHGKAANPSLKVGVCGEHGGDPDSIEFFNRSGLDYVSCSPYRIPIARLVAAQAQINKPEVENKAAEFVLEDL
jgi:pyruvate,orthophosphate dikinase